MQSFVITCLVASAYGDLGALWGGVKDFFGKQAEVAQTLRNGKNPLGQMYQLPEDARWVRNASFTEAHRVAHHTSQGSYCETTGVTRVCFREVARNFHVQGQGGFFDVPGRSGGGGLRTNPARGAVIELAAIPALTPETIYKAHRDQGDACHGARIALPPGSYMQSDVMLQISLEVSVFIGGELEDTRVNKVRFFLALADGTCDSFVSPARSVKY